MLVTVAFILLFLLLVGWVMSMLFGVKEEKTEFIFRCQYMACPLCTVSKIGDCRGACQQEDGSCYCSGPDK